MSSSAAAEFAARYPVCIECPLATPHPHAIAAGTDPEQYLYTEADLPPVPPVQSSGPFRPAWNFAAMRAAAARDAQRAARAALPRDGYVNPAVIHGTATGTTGYTNPAMIHGTATGPTSPTPRLVYDTDGGGYITLQDLDARKVY